jgi:hypothetical protein
VKANPKNTLERIDRASIRRYLRAGLTPDSIRARNTDRAQSHEVFLTALEEEARLEGTLRSILPTPANVARLRDQNLRWERIAVRVFGEPRWVVAAKTLYEADRGAGTSQQSYTGRGRRFLDMKR